MSNRNYLYVEGYKFGFHKFLSNAKKRWRCVNRHCYSYIKTDLNNIIVDFRLDHMHDSNPELIRAKKMNDTVLTHTVRWENRQVCINNLLENLFASQTMTDVTILCGNQRLSAHKFILSASSDYFHRCFANLYASDHPVLILKEVPYRHMKLLLEFMYKGSLSLSKNDYEAMKKSAKYLEINSFLSYALSNVKQEPVENTQQVVDNNSTIVENNHEINSNDVVAPLTNVHSTQQRFVDNNTHKIFDSSEVTLLSIKTQNPEANKFRSLLEESPSVEILRPPQSVQTNQMNAQEEEPVEFNDEQEPLMPVVEIVEEPCDFNFDSNFTKSEDKCVVNSKCVHCNEEFVDDYNLNVHLKKAHEKIYKPFSCEFCHINFTRSSHLQRHRRQHTGERPFVCDVCGRAFARGDKLKHHFKTAHADIEYVPKTKRHRNNANSDGLLTQQLNVNIPTNSAAKDIVSVQDPSSQNDQISPSSSTSSQNPLNSLSESGHNHENVHIKQEAVSDSEASQGFQDNPSNVRPAPKMQKGRGDRKRPYNSIKQEEYGLSYFFTQNLATSQSVDMDAEADGDSNGDDNNEENQMNGNSSIIETNPMANFMIEPNIEITTDNKIINPV